MPLYVEGKLFDAKFTSASMLLEKFPSLKHSAESVLQQEVKQYKTLPNTVYVYQREIAVTHPDDDVVDVLGSDEATTCHILILRHTGSGVTALSHFDGCQTHEGLASMIQTIQEMVADRPVEGRIEAHVFGGFKDPRNISSELTCEIVAAFQLQSTDIHLRTLCCSEVNNVVKDGQDWPVLYGVAINVKSGAIFPAEFEDKGAEPDLRSARIFGGVQKMLQFYDSKTGEFRIPPFDYNVQKHVEVLLGLPDPVFLKYTSTSPDVEKPGYAQKTRETYRFMLTHPQPIDTVFQGKCIIYHLDQGEETWKKKSEAKTS